LKTSIREKTVALLKDNPSLAGHVTAVFNRSFDARLDSFLFHFTPDRNKLHPLSIQIPETLLDFVSLQTPVRLNYPTLLVGSQSFHSPTIIPEIRKNPVQGDLLSSNLDCLRKCVVQFGQTSDFFKNPPASFQRILTTFSRNHFLAASDYLPLFGAGDGLTPSFDDFFTGLLLMDRRLGHRRIQAGERFFELLKFRTTLTSYWQLRMAQEGHLTLLFEHFLNTLVSRPLKYSDCLPCLRVGHTSGTDLMRGIEWYLTQERFLRSGESPLCPFSLN